MSTIDYSIGDIIAYRAFGGEIRRVRVYAKHDDVKNGWPGFDGEMVDENNQIKTSVRKGFPARIAVWGYDDQIVAVNDRLVRIPR
jgi:hypothetical protein